MRVAYVMVRFCLPALHDSQQPWRIIVHNDPRPCSMKFCVVQTNKLRPACVPRIAHVYCAQMTTRRLRSNMVGMLDSNEADVFLKNKQCACFEKCVLI